MIADFLKRLNEPFPDRHSIKKKCLHQIAAALFIALMLFAFRPFGLDRVPEGLFIICLGFGMVAGLFGCTYHLFAHYILKVNRDMPSWTLWKWILECIIAVSWIGVGNFMYCLYAYPSMPVGWNEFSNMLGQTLLVGVVPVAFSGLLIQMHALKVNLKDADDVSLVLSSNKPTDVVISFPLSSQETVNVNVADIRYVEAMQNYVSLYFVDSGGDGLNSKMIRNTLANTVAQLESTHVVRCHRSFLVNVDSIEQVTGNAQGLKLRLADVPNCEIPVSRSYIPLLKALMA